MRGRWVALFDIDEFFQPLSHKTVGAYLEAHRDVSDLAAVQVQMFWFAGCGGDHDGLVTLNCSQRDEQPVVNARTKCMVRPENVHVGASGIEWPRPIVHPQRDNRAPNLPLQTWFKVDARCCGHVYGTVCSWLV